MKLKKLLLVTIMLAPGMLLIHSQTRKPATAPANPGQESVSAIAKLEDQMRVATLKGDATWWEEYLSDSYTDTDFRGKMSNKAETLALHRSSDLSYETMNLSDRAVHTFNGDTVIVTGKMTIDGIYRGQSLSGDYQFTRVWVKMGLEWKLAASQETRIAP